MSQTLSSLRARGVDHESDAPTLELTDVSVTYNGNGATAERTGGYALQDVSFRLERGDRVAVIGPNGAGKSTLFKLIVGTLRASKGQVKIFGHGPTGHICIGYVPQRNQIDWSFPVTVEDVVMMGRVGQVGLFRWPGRRDRELVRASLERVQMTHLAGKQIGELSGGQQQRVFIARALAQEAELLLLDEPLAGLDIPSREATFEILDSLRPDRVTLLLATHDLNLAAEYFDRVLLLNKRMIGYGTPETVLTPENLLQAYGGSVHVLAGQSGTMLFMDTCCDYGEDVVVTPVHGRREDGR